MAGESYILELRNVIKRFGGITASNNVSVHVPEGCIYGIIGPNGAGKTTLFNMITGVYDTTEGEVVFCGEKINGLGTDDIARKGIARTFQNIRLFDELSVYENVLTACQKKINYSLLDGILHSKKYKNQEKEMQEFCDELLKEVGLYEHKDKIASSLPYGMQRRLEIARALATNPKVILLDEPAAGMNEDESDKLADFIQEIRDTRNVTIVIIDHHMDVIMSICDRITVLNFGTMLAEGNPEEIQNNPEVIAAYLGG